MAGIHSPTLPLDYVRIYDVPVPFSLPDELKNRILYEKVTFIHANPEGASSSKKKGDESKSHGTISRQIETDESKPSGSHAGQGRGKATGGFNYSKALKAALDGAGSSVTSRGDGKFEGGQVFKVSDAPGGRAKVVHLAPDALASGNAEQTLQKLDQLQNTVGSRQGSQAVAAVGSSRAGDAWTQSRSVQQQHAAVMAAAANILYDITDEDAGGGTGCRGTGAARPGTAAATCSEQERPTGLCTPEYILRELSEGPTGQGQLEVVVLLPEVSSPVEVDMWLGTTGVLQVVVAGKYMLKLDLPYPVLDDTSHAKWSKAKKRLSLTLTRKR